MVSSAVCLRCLLNRLSALAKRVGVTTVVIHPSFGESIRSPQVFPKT